MVDVYFAIPSYGMFYFEFLCTCEESYFVKEKLPKKRKFSDIMYEVVPHGSDPPSFGRYG